MSYLEFGTGDISPRSFTFGRAFRWLPKQPFSWFTWVTVQVWAIAWFLSWQELKNFNFIPEFTNQEIPLNPSDKMIVNHLNFLKISWTNICWCKQIHYPLRSPDLRGDCKLLETWNLHLWVHLGKRWRSAKFQEIRFFGLYFTDKFVNYPIKPYLQI